MIEYTGERITWDEALETIAAKMKEAIADPGPQSIAISQGTGRGYNRYTMKMARSLGTGNAITPQLTTASTITFD
mgnify:CR=1 FL=1